MEEKAKDFIKTEILKAERNMFVFHILGTLIGYVGITLWLNAIRTTVSLWFVWILIIIQFLLYCLIFSTSYLRAKVCGLKHFGFPIFATLCVLGRVENWELIIIPLLIVIMLIFSAKNKNVSNERQYLLKD
jgi:hypothetical protein